MNDMDVEIDTKKRLVTIKHEGKEVRVTVNAYGMLHIESFPSGQALIE